MTLETREATTAQETMEDQSVLEASSIGDTKSASREIDIFNTAVQMTSGRSAGLMTSGGPEDLMTLDG